MNLSVGTSASENWLLYRKSRQCDTIFHLVKYPSAYVIAPIPMEDLTKEQILEAATLCKSKSKYKNLPNLAVMYTPISNTILGMELGSFVVKSNHKKKVVYV